jgi:hypothetical protein
VPKDDIYLPIHCGAALSSENLDMQRDDDGDNISVKNPSFCELTGLYWAWKNLKDVDYIGLCHYRRYFKLDRKQNNVIESSNKYNNNINHIQSILKQYDIILPQKYHNNKSVYEIFSRFVTEYQLQIFIRVFLKKYPEYKKTLTRYLIGNKSVHCNMFISNKDVFNLYCDFLFPILNDVSSKFKTFPYSFYNRSTAILAELILPIYCIHNKMKIKYMPIYYTEKVNNNYFWKKILTISKIPINNILFYLYRLTTGKVSIINNYFSKYLTIDNIDI